VRIGGKEGPFALRAPNAIIHRNETGNAGHPQDAWRFSVEVGHFQASEPTAHAVGFFGDLHQNSNVGRVNCPLFPSSGSSEEFEKQDEYRD